MKRPFRHEIPRKRIPLAATLPLRRLIRRKRFPEYPRFAGFFQLEGKQPEVNDFRVYADGSREARQFASCCLAIVQDSPLNRSRIKDWPLDTGPLVVPLPVDGADLGDAWPPAAGIDAHLRELSGKLDLLVDRIDV